MSPPLSSPLLLMEAGLDDGGLRRRSLGFRRTLEVFMAVLSLAAVVTAQRRRSGGLPLLRAPGAARVNSSLDARGSRLAATTAAGVAAHVGMQAAVAAGKDSAVLGAVASGTIEGAVPATSVAEQRGADEHEFDDDLQSEVLVQQSERRYSRMQFLGFNLFTAPGTAADGCFGDGGEELESCYLGHVRADRDLFKREEIMLEAINRTFTSTHWDRSPDTLKVFVVPEFYWRGRHGAYRLDPRMASRSRHLVGLVQGELAHPRYDGWLFILGTIVAAQEADERWVNKSGIPFENISYYNFAPIHVGGSTESYLHFKHFISGIDFLQGEPSAPRSQPVMPPPGISSAFCKKYPKSNGCIYAEAPKRLLDDFGFARHQMLNSGVMEIGGLRIGLEICLDHAVGELCRRLGPDKTVDAQIIVSAGMNIPSGPVCTRPGGPVFLADGFARTELSLNQLGYGRHAAKMPDGYSERYEVGVVYGADALVGLQQWIGDSIDAYTGYGFGSRFPGEGTLPGGSSATGETGVKFVQVSALGDEWLDQVDGFYDVANYLQAQRIDRGLEDAMAQFLAKENKSVDTSVERAALFPTVDIYGPLLVGSASHDKFEVRLQAWGHKKPIAAWQ
eukprot:CAMPEP_0176070066 /NCGR_PEP_ID=MMETSP0120_2-20121206/34986_1 /TAXON_ID=160619 /ORGANISM="Kryptoperidinium foliaceum, Strain CCMP 1326" /LENGTH=617 /DNA_ID=CAMNT_0017403705 /DNA_START=1 /DNA_END=1852 /DNA_ORIENTATION=-